MLTTQTGKKIIKFLFKKVMSKNKKYYLLKQENINFEKM
jgi:hypothetical protein